jgi:hypothetical protein
MIQQIHSVPASASSFTLSGCQRKALSLVREAWNAAHDQDCDVWRFAVEISQLWVSGVNHTDLRRLLCWGLLEHAQEQTTRGSNRRVFRHLDTLALPRRTCFVLSVKGWALASAGVLVPPSAPLSPQREPAASDKGNGVIPRWDGELRQLWWQDHLIKQFRSPADNQEAVLDALEEEGWPMRIDDPLPRTHGIDPKARLHDALKSLNRHQVHRLLCFRGDGKGSGICWLPLQRE